MTQRPKKIRTSAVLQRMLRQAFPELHWRKAELITEGWDHEVLILDDALVFRFPNDEDYARQLRNEVTVLRRLEPLVRVRVPRYQYIPESADFAGYPIVPGEPLERAYFDALPPAGREAIARQLAGLFTVMHTVIARGHDFSSVPAAHMPDDQAEVRENAERYLPGELNAAEMAAVRRILQEVDAAIAQTVPAVFIHGDIYNRHLLWDAPAHMLGVIDFSDMNRGDPAIDFAELYEYGQAFVNDVYRQYDGPKDVSFLDRAWAYQQWAGVYVMADFFTYQRGTFAEARHTFDWVTKPDARKRGRS